LLENGHGGEVMSDNNAPVAIDAASKPDNRLELILAFGFGLLFCGILAFIVIRGTPIADPMLVFVLRVLTSLSAAAVAAVIPGFIALDLKTSALVGIRAGGALAVFVLVFAVNPPALVQTEETRVEAAMLANKAAELYDDADRSADDLLRLNPRSGPALNVKGSVAFYRRDYRNAVEYFERAIAVNRKLAWVSNLAYAYIEVGAYQKSIELLGSIEDGKPDWYFSAGRAYLYANDFSRARKELQAVPSSFWHGAGRVLEAASLVGLAQTSDAATREALLVEARAKLNEGIQQDPDYWRGILKAGRTDIHLGYDKPRALLAELVGGLQSF
jgi:tetratricopeptide (TPR) repeat protein